MIRTYGIDVSHHQGPIQWARTAAWLKNRNAGRGPGFALIRAGYSRRDGTGGLVLDARAAENMAGALAAGVPCGAYVYSYDRSPAAARRTARDTARFLSAYRLGYPVFYDIEYEPFNVTAGKALNTSITAAFCRELEARGFYVGVYASRDFFRNQLQLRALAAWDKWEAAYTLQDTAHVKNGIWQYSCQGTVDGIVPRVDLDLAAKNYPAIMARAGLNGYRKEDG